MRYLAVDSDTVLAGAVAGERFQAVSRGRAQVIQRRGGIKHLELAFCDFTEV